MRASLIHCLVNGIFPIVLFPIEEQCATMKHYPSSFILRPNHTVQPHDLSSILKYLCHIPRNSLHSVPFWHGLLVTYCHFGNRACHIGTSCGRRFPLGILSIHKKVSLTSRVRESLHIELQLPFAIVSHESDLHFIVVYNIC